MNHENLHTGYIKLWRSVYENPFHPLNQHRKFTQFEAMQDLILQARGNKEPKTLKGVQIKRGQFATTQRQLAHRWMWSLETVNKFLNVLEKTEHFIERKTERSFTVLTIANYELYNPLDEQKTEQGPEQKSERKTEHLVKKDNKFKKKINKRKKVKSEKTRKETNGEMDRGKDASFDHLLDTCNQLKMRAALRCEKYLNLREIYFQKLNWSAQIKKCLLYNYNNDKKSIHANTILNWMEMALKIQKNNEEKIRNHNEDKKYLPPVITKSKTWSPPKQENNKPVTKDTIERLKKQVAEKFSIRNS